MRLNYIQRCPYDWKSAWQSPWEIACGGAEIPCQVNGKWYLMVLNTEEQTYYHYCFNEDVFKTEKEFEELISPDKFAKHLGNFIFNPTKKD